MLIAGNIEIIAKAISSMTPPNATTLTTIATETLAKMLSPQSTQQPHQQHPPNPANEGKNTNQNPFVTPTTTRDVPTVTPGTPRTPITTTVAGIPGTPGTPRTPPSTTLTSDATRTPLSNRGTMNVATSETTRLEERLRRIDTIARYQKTSHIKYVALRQLTDIPFKYRNFSPAENIIKQISLLLKILAGIKITNRHEEDIACKLNTPDRASQWNFIARNRSKPDYPPPAKFLITKIQRILHQLGNITVHIKGQQSNLTRLFHPTNDADTDTIFIVFLYVETLPYEPPYRVTTLPKRENNMGYYLQMALYDTRNRLFIPGNINGTAFIIGKDISLACTHNQTRILDTLNRTRCNGKRGIYPSTGPVNNRDVKLAAVYRVSNVYEETQEMIVDDPSYPTSDTDSNYKPPTESDSSSSESESPTDSSSSKSDSRTDSSSSESESPTDSSSSESESPTDSSSSESEFFID